MISDSESGRGNSYSKPRIADTKQVVLFLGQIRSDEQSQNLIRSPVGSSHLPKIACGQWIGVSGEADRSQVEDEGGYK